MSGIKLIDTSALIEYLDQTGKGKQVKEIIEEENIEILIPSIVIAELTSKLKRRKLDTKIVLKICESSTVLDLDDEIARIAGELHAELKLKIDSISLADCIIATHAQNENAQIITCDHHFKEYKNAKIIE